MRLRSHGLFGTLLTLSIFMNALSPQRVLNAEETDTLSTALRGQSAIINLCIASTIPLRIINSYLMEHGFGTPEQGKHTPQQPPRNEPPCGDEILPCQPTQYKSAEKSTNGFGNFSHGTLPARLLPRCVASPSGSSPIAAMGCIMLLFFFLLPRSSINENAVMSTGAY